LVVLLTAVALGQVGLGLVLIISFSLGLAAVLTGMGLLLVYAGNFFKRIPTQGGFITLAPVISAVVIITLGAGIAYRGFVATGLFG
jgi:ABC-type nickel/cobalt efflux system permease component RcnA